MIASASSNSRICCPSTAASGGNSRRADGIPLAGEDALGIRTEDWRGARHPDDLRNRRDRQRTPRFLVIGPAADGLEPWLGTLPRIASLVWVALLDGAVDACNTRCLS